MASEKDIQNEFNEAYNHAAGKWGEWLDQAEKDLKFYLGEQWTAADKKYLQEQRREALVFNHVRKIVKLISGYQRKHRLALKVDPIENLDEKSATQLSALVQWVMQYSTAYNTMSDGFEQGPLKTGFNLIEPYISYDEDPINGDIMFRRIPYNRFLVDPNFTERNFGDSGYMIVRDYVTKGGAKMLMPKYADRIEKLQTGTNDNKFALAGPVQDPMKKNRLRYDRYIKQDYAEVYVLVDPRTGMWRELPVNTKKKAVKLIMAQYPNLKVLKKYKKTVKTHIFIEDELFYEGPNPDGQMDYPFIPLLGFWDPEYGDHKDKLQGIIRCMRDPQTEANKRRSKILDIIDSQITSGWEVEEDSIVNPAALYQSGQGKVVWKKKGKGTTNQRLDPPQIPPALFQIQELMDRDIMEIPGANKELMAQPDNDQKEMSGILAKIRQGQGLTILQDLFDNYRASKSRLGRQVIDLIRINFTPRKISNVIDEMPSKALASKAFGKYHCLPKEGLLSDSQREMYYMELMSLKQMGAPVPWSAIMDVAPIEQKDKLKQQVAQAEQAQQKQLDQQNMLTTAMSVEQIASAQEDRAQAVEHRAGAALDRVKVLKELEQMDFENLKTAVDAVKAILETGREDRQQITRR